MPLVLAIFVAGAGIGALVIALSRNTRAKTVVVKRVLTTPSAPASAPAATTAANTLSTRANRKRQRPARPRPRATPLVDTGAPSSFASLEGRLGGVAGIAVAPLGNGPIQAFGSFQDGHAWSTMKVPVLVTLLSDYEHSNQVLSPGGRDYAARAIEQSDNAAAEALFGQLEQIDGGLVAASAAVQQTLANAGDATTAINTAPNSQGFTTWGQSMWSTSGEVIFYRALARGCLLAPSDTAYVLGLMRNVIGSQRWGAGAAGYPSTTPVAFKAGWGPESSGYLVRQTAIVGSGNRGYVVSMIAEPGGGSFSDGVGMITSIAAWARQHLALGATSPPASCTSSP
jgi:beta-lactamase class A